MDEFAAHGYPANRIAQVASVDAAIDAAISDAGANDLVLVTGSLFVAAEAREAVLGIEPETYPDLLPPDLR